jgi:hypothetical protein
VDSKEEVCGESSTGGIQGNENPWLLGAAATSSEEGRATPAHRQLAGAIDSLRISDARRDFSTR